jgi:predicted methyltransferase MtxX (methanogen marker protein 4)
MDKTIMLLEEANEIFVSMFGIDEGPTINDIVKNEEESERERII